MEVFIRILNLIAGVAFAVSGAMIGLRKRMDVFGVIILGITTAAGGGIIRDVLLGNLPPVIFSDPLYMAVAAVTSLVVFLPRLRHVIMSNRRLYELLIFAADTLGLGLFTVLGVQTAFLAHTDNYFLIIFVATLTGVGGGVLRDILAGDTPYIFVKHIYACAAIAGACVCTLLWRTAGSTLSMLLGSGTVIVIRILAAHYRWSLPRANPEE